MKVCFSVDLRDKDGDVYEECILIHVDNRTILKFNSFLEVSDFSNQVGSLLKEFKDNLPIERQ